MTDPVRPVAPREDVNVLAKAIVDAAKRLGITEATTPMTGPEVMLLLQEIEWLAAAPVQCAASPADRLTEREEDAAWESRQLRATGEGARDERLQTAADVALVPSTVRAVDAGSTLRADAPVAEGARDAVTGVPTVPVPPVAAVEELAAVAVSLDPHRWIHARIDDLKDSAIAGFKNHDARLIVLETELARLRGEATVRVEE